MKFNENHSKDSGDMEWTRKCYRRNDRQRAFCFTEGGQKQGKSALSDKCYQIILKMIMSQIVLFVE